ncbi:MAG: endonuclease III domain-containing protein [Candidatus Uhrbacteria bacterium]|nr:endonuclease III domain-containing protein [Candidatus Uhrbacteria bacterium]
MDSIQQALQHLEKRYGPQGWWPGLVMEHGTWNIKHGAKPSERFLKNKSAQAFEVAIGAILTQNTSWSNVEKALICLAKKKLLTPQAIIASRPSILASCIRSSGYFRQKTKKLKILSKFVMNELDGDLSQLVDRCFTLHASRFRLLSLWGIGPETADTILLYGLNQPTFVVDAYTRRWLTFIGGRGGFETRPYEEIKNIFESALPHSVKTYQESHALIVKWGKERHP